MNAFTRKNKKRNACFRGLSLAVLVSFATSHLGAMPAYMDGADRRTPASDTLSDLYAVQVPAEIGIVDEIYRASGAETVVLIQDAHALPTAQRNIQKLIGYFQGRYGLRLTALEGAFSELDAQIFKSFPDPDAVKTVFKRYMELGELTGPTAAAIFHPVEGLYGGIEDRRLYEAGLGYYLGAMAMQSDSLNRLEAVKKSLKKEKERFYSKTLLELEDEIERFSSKKSDLLYVLKRLAVVVEPEEGSGLAVILKENRRNDSTDHSFNAEIRQLARAVESRLGANAAIQGLNQNFQAFQTSQFAAGRFLLYLKRIIARHHLPLQISPRLRDLAESHQRLDRIQGKKLFSEFNDYVNKVKNALFRNEQEKVLEARGRHLELLTKLVNLELSYDEWALMRSQGIHRLADNEIRDIDFSSAVAFYENSGLRDRAFFDNLRNLMNQHSVKTAIVVAGGFHAEGLIRRFKKNHISYLLVRPEIGPIPVHNFYQRRMRGKSSWQSYLRIESGKVNLSEAFVRGTRDLLLKQSSDPGLLLKQWRDELIRDLAEKNSIERAREYTRFIDEVLEQKAAMKGITVDQLREEWRKKIGQFVAHLINLESENRLTEKNVFRLIRKSMILQALGGNMNLAVLSSLNAKLVPGLAERGPLNSRSGVGNEDVTQKKAGHEKKRLSGGNENARFAGLETFVPAASAARFEVRSEGDRWLRQFGKELLETARKMSYDYSKLLEKGKVIATNMFDRPAHEDLGKPMFFQRMGDAETVIKVTRDEPGVPFKEAKALRDLGAKPPVPRIPRLLKIGTLTEDGAHSGRVWIEMSGLKGGIPLVQDPVDRFRRENSKIENGIEFPYFKRHPDRLLDVLIQTGETLRAMHAKGVLHNDVKPANILVNSKGEVLLIDFETAEKIGKTLRWGSPLFKAPEDKKSEKSEVFSFVKTILHALGYFARENGLRYDSRWNKIQERYLKMAYRVENFDFFDVQKTSLVEHIHEIEEDERRADNYAERSNDPNYWDTGRIALREDAASLRGVTPSEYMDMTSSPRRTKGSFEGKDPKHRPTLNQVIGQLRRDKKTLGRSEIRKAALRPESSWLKADRIKRILSGNGRKYDPYFQNVRRGVPPRFYGTGRKADNFSISISELREVALILSPKFNGRGNTLTKREAKKAAAIARSYSRIAGVTAFAEALYQSADELAVVTYEGLKIQHEHPEALALKHENAQKVIRVINQITKSEVSSRFRYGMPIAIALDKNGNISGLPFNISAEKLAETLRQFPRSFLGKVFFMTDYGVPEALGENRIGIPIKRISNHQKSRIHEKAVGLIGFSEIQHPKFLQITVDDLTGEIDPFTAAALLHLMIFVGIWVSSGDGGEKTQKSVDPVAGLLKEYPGLGVILDRQILQFSSRNSAPGVTFAVRALQARLSQKAVEIAA